MWSEVKHVCSDERIARFLDRVCVHLVWPPYRARVRRELTDHILTRAAYLQRERGFSAEEAVAQAILQLGGADEIGHDLRRAQHPLRRLGCVLATCLLWTSIAWCALYLLLYFLSAF